jgi:hypothetical protein
MSNYDVMKEFKNLSSRSTSLASPAIKKKKTRTQKSPPLQTFCDWLRNGHFTLDQFLVQDENFILDQKKNTLDQKKIFLVQRENFFWSSMKFFLVQREVFMPDQSLVCNIHCGPKKKFGLA